MRLVILATDDQLLEMASAFKISELVVVHSSGDFFNEQPGDIYFNLMEDACSRDYSNIKAPIIINSVIITLKEMKAGPNVLRINGWPGFLKRPAWEIAGERTGLIDILFADLQKECIHVSDKSALPSARVISLIVNEAYFALGEEISSKEEIDIALKLGTNYPYGPFEWSDRIGLANIYLLLMELSRTDKRYLPAPALVKEVSGIT